MSSEVGRLRGAGPSRRCAVMARRRAATGETRSTGRATIISGMAEQSPRRGSLRDVGEDPDPRFTFANERTFLAWNRTALALIGGGLAAGQLLEFDAEWVRLLVSLPPILLGGVLALTSYRRWEANERAMRLREPLPIIGPPRFVPPAIAILAVLIAVLVVVGAVRA